MKKTTKAQVTVNRETSEYFCDFCKSKLMEKMYEVSEVTISFKHGESYPEGGGAKIEEVDCCGKCWMEKVVPAFAALGVAPREEDLSW